MEVPRLGNFRLHPQQWTEIDRPHVTYRRTKLYNVHWGGTGNRNQHRISAIFGMEIGPHNRLLSEAKLRLVIIRPRAEPDNAEIHVMDAGQQKKHVIESFKLYVTDGR